jgi:hypothetical protein
LDIVRQMIVHSTAPVEPDRVTDQFLRGLEHGHTLVEQWKDTERVLMAIGEICLMPGCDFSYMPMSLAEIGGREWKSRTP